jgi:hypothetical protein
MKTLQQKKFAVVSLYKNLLSIQLSTEDRTINAVLHLLLSHETHFLRNKTTSASAISLKCTICNRDMFITRISVYCKEHRTTSYNLQHAYEEIRGVCESEMRVSTYGTCRE